MCRAEKFGTIFTLQILVFLFYFFCLFVILSDFLFLTVDRAEGTCWQEIVLNGTLQHKTKAKKKMKHNGCF